LRLSSAYKQCQTIVPIRERERERERDRDPISCGASGNLAYNRVKVFGLTFPSSHDQNPTKSPHPLSRNLLEGSQLAITPDKIPKIQGNHCATRQKCKEDEANKVETVQLYPVKQNLLD